MTERQEKMGERSGSVSRESSFKWEELYEITKTLCNDRSKAVSAVKDKSRNLITEEETRTEVERPF